MEQVRIFNATSALNKFWNTKVLSKKTPKFNGVYSRNNLPKIKDGAYVSNFDEYKLGIHWIALCINAENVTYFDSFGVEHIPKEITKFLGNKNIITYIYRIQAYESVMCGCFCIGLTDWFYAKRQKFAWLYKFIFS